VAEDLRGLARSLARDLRAAADQVRDQSRSVHHAARHAYGPPPPTNGADEQQHDPAGAGNGEGGQGGQGATAQDPWRWGHDWTGWQTGARGWGPPNGWGRRPRHRRDPWAHWGPPNPPTTVASGGATTSSPGTVTAAPPAHRPRRQPPPLRHKRDGSTLVGALALVFGLAWLATRTHLVSLSTETVVAVALLVVGGTMVVTARTDWALSRRAWPALLGAALVLAAIASSTSLGLPTDWRDLRVGSHTTPFTTWEGLP